MVANTTIKAAFFDVDGTLVSFTTHEMSSSTKNVLKIFRERGIKCFISSGRAWYELQPFIVNAFDAYITLNGQYCFDDTGVFLDTPISDDDVVPIIDLWHTGVCELVIHERDHVYASGINQRVMRAMQEVNLKYTVGSMENAGKNPVYQICAFLPKHKDRIVLSAAPGMSVMRWSKNFCDIIPQEGGKLRGVKATMERYGLKRDEILAFGDGGKTSLCCSLPRSALPWVMAIKWHVLPPITSLQEQTKMASGMPVSTLICSDRFVLACDFLHAMIPKSSVKLFGIQGANFLTTPLK